MRIFRGFEGTNINEGTAVTVGKFDGLHMGHDKLIEHIVGLKKMNLLSTVVTFDRPPAEVIFDRNEQTLMTREEKHEIIREHNVDILLELPFDDDIRTMSPKDFVKNLIKCLNMKQMTVGDDFRFGHMGLGNTGLLFEYSKEYGFELTVVEKIKSDKMVISSTLIRDEIAAGNIKNANRLLGYNYFVAGRVIHGNGIGAKKVGFATINIIPPQEKLLPENGVYITEVFVDGRRYCGITNVGVRPTIDEDVKRIGIETHILDFDEDIYERNARIVFLERIRSEMKFASIDELKKQIEADIKTTYSFFEANMAQSPTIYGVDI